MPKQCLKWEEAILQILSDKKTPVHYSDIAKAIGELGLRPSEKMGLTPSSTVNVILHHQLKNKVTTVGKGNYILTSVLNANNLITPPLVNGTDDDEDIEDDLITAYGRFWSRHLFMENNARLFGSSVKDANAERADFTELPGIYLLHKGYQVVYIGQAKNLGKRIKDHTLDDKRNRWDNFSWFSIEDLKDSNSDIDKGDTKKLTQESVLDTLEALLIETIGPERNKKVGNNFEDHEFEQVTSSVYFESKYNKKK